MVKNTRCSCRGPRFHSQHPHPAAHNHLNSSSREPPPSASAGVCSPLQTPHRPHNTTIKKKTNLFKSTTTNNQKSSAVRYLASATRQVLTYAPYWSPLIMADRRLQRSHCSSLCSHPRQGQHHHTANSTGTCIRCSWPHSSGLAAPGHGY